MILSHKYGQLFKGRGGPGYVRPQKIPAQLRPLQGRGRGNLTLDYNMTPIRSLFRAVQCDSISTTPSARTHNSTGHEN